MTEGAFVDTNVVLYSFDPNALHHDRSKALVEHTRNHDANLWVSPQIFCEIFRYVTHPKATSPRKPGEVVDELEACSLVQVSTSFQSRPTLRRG